MPRQRRDTSYLTDDEVKIVRMLATVDESYNQLAKRIFLSPAGMKYHLLVIRSYYGGANTTPQIVYRAHLCGDLDDLYGPGYERLVQPKLKLSTKELNTLWLVGKYGGPMYLSRNTDLEVETVKERMRKVRRKYGHITSAAVLIHYAFAGRLFDQYLVELPPEERKRPEPRVIAPRPSRKDLPD